MLLQLQLLLLLLLRLLPTACLCLLMCIVLSCLVLSCLVLSYCYVCLAIEARDIISEPLPCETNMKQMCSHNHDGNPGLSHLLVSQQGRAIQCTLPGFSVRNVACFANRIIDYLFDSGRRRLQLYSLP